MSDYRTTGVPEKKYFNPSTIENIDRSIYEYISNLNLSVKTKDGFEKVPVLWGTSERSFLSKTDKQVRDQQGMLKLPLISIKRSGVQKTMPSKGVFQGTVFETDDEQGGSLVVSRVINQEKTRAYAKSTAKRTTQDSSYPIANNKIVYQTISAPMPVNVEINYEIILRTEYQQQMNNLMLPFITNPGTINYIKLENDGHRYEGFIEGQFSSKSNLSDYSNDERKFETSITIRVIGYLVGQENNREKPHFSVRENFVEVKIPKESVIIDPDELEKYGL
jgi:hypothetical protein